MLAIVVRFVVLISLVLTAVGVTPLPTDSESQRLQRNQSRLHAIARYGGAIQAAVLHNADAIVAESESLTRVPVAGPNAYTATERLFLDAGLITDMASGTNHIYVLTTSHLLTVQVMPLAITQRFNGGGQHLDRSGDWLMVAATQRGTQLYRIGMDGLLSATVHIPTAGDAGHATMTSKQVVAIAEGSSGIRFVDVSGPNTSREGRVLSGLVPATQVVSFDTWVYATQEHYLHVINTIDPQNPAVISTYAPLHNIRDMVWQDGWLIIADSTDGLKFYRSDSLTDQPHYFNSQRGKPAYQVVSDPERNTILTTYRDGLRLYELNRLPELSEQRFVPLWETPTSLTNDPDNKLAYVGLGPGGIAIVDYESPLIATVQGDLPFSGPVQDVLLHPIDRTLLYALLGDGRLVTVRLDLNDPRASRVISDMPVPGSPQRMAINANGTVIGVASGRGGVHFYDLGRLSVDPRLVFTQAAYAFDSTGATSITVTDRGQWIVWDGNRLRVLRLDGNRDARLVGDIPMGEIGPGVIYRADEGLWWGQYNRLRGFVLNGDTPRPTTSYTAPTHYHDGQALLGQVVLVGDQTDNGLVLLDVTDPFFPHEKQIITTDFVPQAMTVRGDDILLTQPEAGLAHLRLPMAATDQAISPDVVAFWPSLSQADRSLHFDGDQWLVLGDEGTRLSLANNQMIPLTTWHSKAGLVYQQTAIFLDEQHRLVRTDIEGSVLVRNDQLALRAIALDGDVLWGIGFDSLLQALDAQTLQIGSPARQVQLDVYPTNLMVLNKELLVGTSDGELIRLQAPTGVQHKDDLILTRLPNLGGPVESLTIIAGSSDQVIVSTRDGGAWWLRLAANGRIDVLARYSGETLAADLSPNGQWLAVAGGSCGVRILDARQRDLGLRDYAQWPLGTASDVRFVDDQQLLAIVDGAPVMLEFAPNGRPWQPAPPTDPWPVHRQVLTEPVTELRWSTSATTCDATTYEVIINGQMVGTTSTLEWPLGRMLSRDIEWQVIAVGNNGERVEGPVWQAVTEADGWFASPLNLNVRLSQDEDGASQPWRILLAMLGVLGIFGLLVIGWRLVSQRIMDYE